MKNSKTVKRSLQPYIHLPPIAKQLTISEEDHYGDPSNSTQNSNRRPSQKYDKIPMMKKNNINNRFRNNSEHFSNENHNKGL